MQRRYLLCQNSRDRAVCCYQVVNSFWQVGSVSASGRDETVGKYIVNVCSFTLNETKIYYLSNEGDKQVSLDILFFLLHYV